jgi:hypothetical protein
MAVLHVGNGCAFSSQNAAFGEQNACYAHLVRQMQHFANKMLGWLDPAHTAG